MSFWDQKCVLVTGGNGFLGSHLLEKLQRLGCQTIFAPQSSEYDLRDTQAIRLMLKSTCPDLLIHLAAVCGGIEANRLRPGTFFYDNAMMGIQLIEESRKFGVKRVVVLGTICAYPKFTPIPFREDNLWNGYPEETNAPYGLAKKMLLVQLQAYRQQYNFDGIYLLPANLYGPRDNFDLTTSHVIPALIRKMMEAKRGKKTHVTLWGTGKASREFLYVEDCAEGILKAAELYHKPEPVNLGTGKSILIRDLADLIRSMVGYEGEIRWDVTKPDGQPQRQLDITRAQEQFGFKAKISLKEGIRKTIEWVSARNSFQKGQ